MFLERIGAALVAPRAALRAADRGGAEGRTAGDATALVALSFFAIYFREIVAAIWVGSLEGFGVGFGLVLGVASRVLAMKLAVLFIAALVLTLAAGRARSLGRDFDLACVAFVPYLTVEIVGSLVLRTTTALGLGLGPWFHVATEFLAYGWAGGILLLAWFHTQTRRADKTLVASSLALSSERSAAPPPIIGPEVTP